MARVSSTAKNSKSRRRASGQLWHDIVEATPNAIIIVDLDGRIEMVNRQAELVFGYSREQLIGQPVDMLVPVRFRANHPDLRRAFLDDPQSRLMGEGRDLYAQRRDGSEFPVEIGLNPITTDAGPMVLAAVADISHRKQLEDRFRQVVEFSPQAKVLIDSDGRIEMVNRQCERLFGYDRSELLGRPIEILVPERFRDQHPDLRKSFFALPDPRAMGAGRDLFGRRKDGSEFPVEIGLNPIDTVDGVKVLSAIVDISVRKALERQLYETSELLKATLDAAPFPIMVTSPEGTVMMWNQAGERIFGFTSEELVGNSFYRLVPQRDESHAEKIFRDSSVNALTQGVRINPVHKEGRQLTVNLFNAPIFYSDGRVRAVVSTFEDLTQKEATEAQLRQAQKMEAIGNLTGGMAHDFNNLLGVIMGNLDLLRSARPHDTEVIELASEAFDAAVGGAELCRRMLAFSRRQTLQPQRVLLNDLVRNISKLLSRVLRENIDITLRLSDGVWPVVADPGQIEAALTNLATNARDAMPGGGRITIATSNRALDADYVLQEPGLQPGDYAVVEVADTGTGMPPGVLARIFEPFYSTKERDKGTGLGLSMVFGFVKQSGGHISVYSEPGVGTTFRIYLPRDPNVDIGKAAGSTPPPDLPAISGQTVLAVEDNLPLRRALVRQLEQLGYRVIEAGTAAEALVLLERGGIDLVFSDVVMPGSINGFELARQVTEKWPHLKVVLTSGFSEIVPNDVATALRFPLLAKPYTREDLAKALWKSLSVSDEE
jgi:PAS domain S-box-containing protein